MKMEIHFFVVAAAAAVVPVELCAKKRVKQSEIIETEILSSFGVFF